ncbi:sigma-54-dependent Fis family transcriptional regulator [Prodigiosinella confusarubida]|uniref:GvrA n=1 Tax=Serratia sp. (strain ATCC 39006) TaxID=104623 RepID=M9WR92_SERS3|nr:MULTISPECIES: sigma-54 dependent transcriptional regulator [Enterobacterales]AGJ98300.1 GvrA [Serratia sp. ATCC 39006]AUG98563.1 sigma-54-dependent Fis family transcriptional regulator [Serratia sp. ATCC 39006]AUH02878.1 sigma-54-dependent Fis family transcriptional regulator [Serratia sp. ATCC 39006]
MKSIDPGYVLIIDDDKDICDLLSHLLEKAGCETQQGYDGDMAIKLLSQREPDVLLLDSILPKHSGMEVLANAHALYPQLPVIIITGNVGILSAVGAIKAGAWDYIPKPFDNKRVLDLVNRAMQMRWGNYDSNCKASKDTKTRIAAMMGNSREIQSVIRDVVNVAHTDFSVVIQGETGTGKELVAKNIHLASQHATGVFVPIDCGSIPDSLIENELFGHEKGSYTGADQVHAGKFEAADGGTLFLDEIANMSLSAQAKLLRVLQEHVVYRIGATKPIPVNVRVLAASNDDLLDAVVKGKFREDLYYRLNEYVIRIPPLRNRHEDILFLSNRFIAETSVELNKTPPDLSVAAKETLLRYPWPGNVRELRAVIRRAVLVSDKRVGVDDLGLVIKEDHFPQSTKNPYLRTIQNFCLEGSSLKEITQLNIDQIERIIIQDTLEKTGNNKAEAARRLNIDYKTLHSKLKKINAAEVNNHE